MTIQQALPDTFGEIAAFIHDRLQSPDTHCIHSETAPDRAGIEQEMRDLAATNEIVYLAARTPDLVGVIGCEYDIDLGRGWLRGPIVDWTDDTIARSLYTELRRLVPPEIKRFDTFLNERNPSGNMFYRSLDYIEMDRSHIYETSAERVVVCESDCTVLAPHQHDSLIELHDTVFSRTFANGRELVDLQSRDKQVIVSASEGHVRGYTRTIKENDAEGYIEYVGVRAEERGKGIGRQLLSKALGYLLTEVGV